MTTIPTLTPAREVLALVEAGAVTREAGLAFLQARVDAAVARGARVKFPTLKAIEKLAGAPVAAPKGATKLQRLAENDAKRREVKLANLAKAREAKAAKAATKPVTPAKATQPKAAANPLNDVARALASLDDKAMAAFMNLVFTERNRTK